VILSAHSRHVSRSFRTRKSQASLSRASLPACPSSAPHAEREILTGHFLLKSNARVQTLSPPSRAGADAPPRRWRRIQPGGSMTISTGNGVLRICATFVSKFSVLAPYEKVAQKHFSVLILNTPLPGMSRCNDVSRTTRRRFARNSA
jgi:hypothetical protein